MDGGCGHQHQNVFAVGQCHGPKYVWNMIIHFVADRAWYNQSNSLVQLLYSSRYFIYAVHIICQVLATA